MSTFSHAPTTRLLFTLTIILSFLSNYFPLNPHLYLDSKILQLNKIPFELHKIITHHFICIELAELLPTCIFLYCFQVFEQRMGSRKFCSRVMISLMFSSISSLILLSFYKEIVFAGPYSIIFSLFVEYYLDVPSLHYNKAAMYAAGAYLLSLRFPSSFCQGLLGILSGIIYQLPLLHLDSLLIPTPLADLAVKYLLPLLEKPPRPSRGSRIPREGLGGPGTGAGGRAGPGVGAAAATAAGVGGVGGVGGVPATAYQFQAHPVVIGPGGVAIHPDVLEELQQQLPLSQLQQQPMYFNEVPSNENIQKLITLGVDRERAISVLAECNNQLQIAIDTIFER